RAPRQSGLRAGVLLPLRAARPPAHAGPSPAPPAGGARGARRTRAQGEGPDRVPARAPRGDGRRARRHAARRAGLRRAERARGRRRAARRAAGADGTAGGGTLSGDRPRWGDARARGAALLRRRAPAAKLLIGTPMASERAETTAVGTAPVAEEAGGVRAALSPYVFRGMLVGMAAVAVALHRATGNRDLAWRFAKARARTLTWMLGVDVRVCGLERLAGGGPFVFAPNHQSHLDILVLLGFLPGRTRFAAKKELWAHPVVGAVLDTLGMVPIDRDHPEQAIDALDRAAAERHSFVIFPEGTRSRRGQLLPFKKGAFVLAIAAGLPIVPVVCR